MTKEKSIELVQEGFANGVAPGGPMDEYQKAFDLSDDFLPNETGAV